jgi:hypothetical protein
MLALPACTMLFCARPLYMPTCTLLLGVRLLYPQHVCPCCLASVHASSGERCFLVGVILP